MLSRLSLQGSTHSRPSDLVWITLAAGLLYFCGLGARDLWNPNEPIYGRAVVEMDQRGDWMVPSINGQVFAEKPILYFWGALAASRLTGEIDEFSLRIPCAIAGIASALLTYLLVLPYGGRRRALIATALFATQYQVFWVARAVQMDGLVLLTTLGALVPLTRMLDFGLRPSLAWSLTGVATGLGFAAKGPVTLILPGLVFFAYAAMEGRLKELFTRHLALGVLVGLVVAAPWYLILALRGETDFLVEVLFRQNFQRFVSAWDHQQPWWYYLKYLWLDYLPWSWLLPAAAFLGPGRQDEAERSLSRLSWLWLLLIIGFFSLSESKRAPYIVPIGPAIAALASGIVDRWLFARPLTSSARRLAGAAFALLTVIFLALGVGSITAKSSVPELFHAAASVVGGVFLAAALLIVMAVVTQRARFVPLVLFAAVTSFLLLAGAWVLPQIDPTKSARGFSSQMAERVDAEGGSLVSYDFWSWRAGYSYYGKRNIPTLSTEDELHRFWNEEAHPFVLLEQRGKTGANLDLPDAELVLEERIGGRTASLYHRRLSD